MKQSSFRDLVVWQKAIELTLAVYGCTKAFPSDERFGLTSQMQRAAVSIPSNIAEGTGRLGKKEFGQFLSIAIGSAAELETQIEIVSRLGYLPLSSCTDITERVIEIKKMLVGLRASVVR